MEVIKAILVDDEVDAREVLETLIKRTGYPIEVVAQSANVMEAVKAIQEHEPDVVFLDVQMPIYAGYELVNFLDKIDFEIIFVTAYDQYAIKAFDLSAIGYLVKPVSREKLKETLDRLLTKIERDHTANEYKILLESIKEREFRKLVIPEMGGKRVLSLQDIICISGKGSYSSIFLKNQSQLLVSKSLKYFEEVLPEDSSFFRSQKSWIINLDYVKTYNTAAGDIHLDDGFIAKLSRHRIDEFEQLMK